jgi:histidine triad (HIT) family protein
MIPPEQSKQIKKQLIEQINSTFSEDKKAPAIEQIKSMNSEQLKEFLIQNKLIKVSEDGKEEIQQTTQCIFCAIIEGKIPSTKIAENEQAIAILEINPISPGHTIIIPKLHVKKDDIPQEAFALAKKVSATLKSKLNPKDILIETSEMFKHGIINVLPIYENENLTSQKQQSNPEELEQLQKILIEKPAKKEVVKEKPKQEINEKNTWLPKRIP